MQDIDHLAVATWLLATRRHLSGTAFHNRAPQTTPQPSRQPLRRPDRHSNGDTFVQVDINGGRVADFAIGFDATIDFVTGDFLP